MVVCKGSREGERRRSQDGVRVVNLSMRWARRRCRRNAMSGGQAVILQVCVNVEKMPLSVSVPLELSVVGIEVFYTSRVELPISE